MSPQRRVVAWSVLALLVSSGLVLSLAAGDWASLVFFVSYALVGAYLAARRPASPIGWLLLLTGLGMAMGSVVIHTPLPDLLAGSLTGTDAVRAWLNASGWCLALASFTGLALAFPDGDLPAGRWAPVARLTILASIVVGALICVYPIINVTVAEAPSGIDIPNPFALAPEHPLWQAIPNSGDVGYPALFVLFLAAGASLATRARTASGVARLQYRWFVAGIAVVALAMAAWAITTFILLQPGTGPTLTLVVLASPAVPLAVAVAVLRYRLYAIDRLISRTVSWAIVTGVLVSVFAVAVLALQPILAGLTQGRTLAVAASTLVAFALFQPLRHRVQDAVDRRFDRARYDGERMAGILAERLRDQVRLDDLESAIATTVDDALRPSAAALWIRPAAMHR